jgi:hypothetical protein
MKKSYCVGRGMEKTGWAWLSQIFSAKYRKIISQKIIHLEKLPVCQVCRNPTNSPQKTD